MYSKENWQSLAEKEPPFGLVNNFQTSPSFIFNGFKWRRFFAPLQRSSAEICQRRDKMQENAEEKMILPFRYGVLRFKKFLK